MEKEKIKGLKFYGLISGTTTKFLNWVSEDIEYCKNHMSESSPLLVEITVTKVYTKNPLIIELEE